MKVIYERPGFLDVATDDEGSGASAGPATPTGDQVFHRGNTDLAPPVSASEAVVYCCRFPNCDRRYASTDGVRKHCRKAHAAWLADLDEHAKCDHPALKSELYCLVRRVAADGTEQLPRKRAAPKRPASPARGTIQEAACVDEDHAAVHHATVEDAKRPKTLDIPSTVCTDDDDSAAEEGVDEEEAVPESLPAWHEVTAPFTKRSQQLEAWLSSADRFPSFNSLQLEVRSPLRLSAPREGALATPSPRHPGLHRSSSVRSLDGGVRSATPFSWSCDLSLDKFEPGAEDFCMAIWA